MSAALESAVVLLEPWLLRALLGGVAVAVPASLIGVLLLYRRMSMLPDALAHAALPGVAIGYLAAGGPGPVGVVGGAVVSGVVATSIVEGLRRHARMRADVAIGVTYSFLFALGVVLVSTVGRRAHIDLDCVLFGNLLGVTDAGLFVMGALAVATTGAVAVSHRALALIVFDPMSARAMGLPVAGVERGMGLAAAAVCAAAFEATGSVLVLALFVLPAATAHRVATGFRGVLMTAVGVGTAMCVTGLVAATALDTSPAGAIACAGAVFYVLSAWSALPGRGVSRDHRGGDRQASGSAAC